MIDLKNCSVGIIDETNINKIVEIDIKSKLNVKRWSSDQILEALDKPNVTGRLVHNANDYVCYFLVEESVDEYLIIRYNGICLEKNLLSGIFNYYKNRMLEQSTKLSFLIDEKKIHICKFLASINGKSRQEGNKIKFTFFHDCYLIWINEAMKANPNSNW